MKLVSNTLREFSILIIILYVIPSQFILKKTENNFNNIVAYHKRTFICHCKTIKLFRLRKSCTIPSTIRQSDNTFGISNFILFILCTYAGLFTEMYVNQCISCNSISPYSEYLISLFKLLLLSNEIIA